MKSSVTLVVNIADIQAFCKESNAWTQFQLFPSTVAFHLFFFCLNVAFHLFLMMAYAQAETSNKTMFSIIVAVLFATRISVVFSEFPS